MIQFHPLADLFPLLEGRDFDELVADIRAHGVSLPAPALTVTSEEGRAVLPAAAAAPGSVELPAGTPGQARLPTFTIEIPFNAAIVVALMRVAADRLEQIERGPGSGGGSDA